MHLNGIDWIIIAAFILVSGYLSFSARKTAESGLVGYFLGGRKMPWFLAGISMVATTFAADTPLTVTELVASNGIAGNWIWWSFLFGGMLTTLFFASLWRRANVLTEIEFIELRYEGKGARFLRPFKAVYLGLIMNMLVIGWVNLAFMSLLEGFFEVNETQQLLICGLTMLVVVVYTAVGGLYGVALADAFQFIIAITGCVILSVLVIKSPQIGGIEGLKAALPKETFAFFPTVKGGGKEMGYALSVGAFIAFAGVMWWSSWYPGAEPGGGGYMAQRMMSTKSPEDAVKSSLFFQIAHYCLRPWPWIIVALASLVLYPELGPDEKRMGFVFAMRDFLPVGLKGLLLAAFLGAYMSTISTQLNWGAGYMVNDIFIPFWKKKRLANGQGVEEEEDKKKILFWSRLTTLILMICGLTSTLFMDNIKEVWLFVMECGAGLGLVLILRWYWWRINVWSEITATVVPFLVFGTISAIKLYKKIQITADNEEAQLALAAIDQHDYLSFPGSLFITVGITTVAWLIVTFLTRPTSAQKLNHFYDQVQPKGNWSGIDKTPQNKPLYQLLLGWLGGVMLIIGSLFSVGSIILSNTEMLWLYLLMIGFGLILLRWILKKGIQV